MVATEEAGAAVVASEQEMVATNLPAAAPVLVLVILAAAAAERDLATGTPLPVLAKDAAGRVRTLSVVGAENVRRHLLAVPTAALRRRPLVRHPIPAKGGPAASASTAP